MPGARGVMLNWIRVEEADVPLVEDWYDFEHLAERVATPGFRRGRRFAVPGGGTGPVDYLTIYETDEVGVLASADYLRRLENPTALTTDAVARFAEYRRAAAVVTVAQGDASGGRVLLLELLDIAPPLLRELVRDRVLPALAAAHLLLSGALYEPDAGVSGAKDRTAEGGDTRTQELADAPVLLLEPTWRADPLEVEERALRLIAAQAPAARLARPAGVYSLITDLRSAD
ncbi:hypothetical protein [Pseudolysinimonas sp.]|uniref:hypothetical protein n=1 Tax=Pseudolysinimonas sp. TaxID=2680009 RepID=UPI003F810472